MSNICSNVLRIVGAPKDVHRFVLDNGDILALNTDEQRLTFRALVPIDAQENAQPHWGVRRDAMDVSAWSDAPWREDQLEASTDFYTDWAPPQTWFEVAARVYPTLLMELTYEETGNALAGQLVAEHGQVTNTLYEDEDTFEDEEG